ncbi:MAG TPA: hypothetical protein VLT10_00125 [Verrucomicrobiae bacterium]|nr:hypothetical protein [Verrucomicrobiae bacterium]
MDNVSKKDYIGIRKILAISLLSIVLALSCFILVSSPVHAQDDNNPLSKYLANPNVVPVNNTAPQEYKVGIQLMNVRNVDRLTGTYDMTFWVVIVSDKIDFTVNPPPELEFVDGINIETSGLHTEKHLVKYKVIGTFQHGFDYRKYPFETLDMTIIMEPFFPLTADKLILTPISYRGSQDSSANNDIPGWDLTPGPVESTTHDYPWGKFSRFIAHYEVDSPPGMTFLKKLFTIIVLNIIVLIAFWFRPTALADRAAIAVGAILASTYYHAQFLLAELPPLGYLTLADKIVIASYALYTFCVVSVLVHHRLGVRYGPEYETKQADRIDKKMRILAPIVLIGTFFIIYPL